MKKNLQTKYLSIFLGLLFLINAFPAPALAEYILDFASTTPLEIKENAVTKLGTTTIINRSDKSYFIPNKTYPEIKSFADKAPGYLEVGYCGDTVCGSGETSESCSSDCIVAEGYCGDGICKTGVPTRVDYNPPRVVPGGYTDICVTKVKWGWLIWPPVGLILLLTDNITYTQCNPTQQTVTYTTGVEPTNEVYKFTYVGGEATQTECPADCAPPAGTGCGVCGYDTNNNLCPNYCSNRGYNMENCAFKLPVTYGNIGDPALVKNSTTGILRYLTAAQALAYSSELNRETNQYTDEGGYRCDFGSDTNNLCPAGRYCPDTQGLKPGTSLTNTLLSSNNYDTSTAPICPAGSFCPTGSYYAHPCPVNTYSSAGAELCTKCPDGKGTAAGGSASIAECSIVKLANDGVCNTGLGSENPINSPYDCPDSNSLSLFANDGRCTGIEDKDNSADCKCGNGFCDNNETYLSCMTDCGCLNNVCGDKKIFNGITTIYPEKNLCKSYSSEIENPSICRYMNDVDICGDNICANGDGYRGEGFNYIEEKIICPLDCHCGNGSCESLKGESLSTCPSDCKCGNGTCDNGLIGNYYFYESSYSCAGDCHCGNSICETAYNENSLNCVSDCRCGDHVCSSNETNSSCAQDCLICNYDGFCDAGAGEFPSTCPDCSHTIMNPF